MYEHWQDTLSFFSDNEFSREERQGIVKTFLPDMIEEGINPTQSLKLFQDADLGIRESDFRGIYRDIRFDHNLGIQIIQLDPKEPIKETIMTISDWNFGSRYKYVTSYGVFDEESGSFVYQEFGFISGDRLSKAEIEDRAFDLLSEKYLYEGAEIINVSTRKVFINPDL